MENGLIDLFDPREAYTLIDLFNFSSLQRSHLHLHVWPVKALTKIENSFSQH